MQPQSERVASGWITMKVHGLIMVQRTALGSCEFDSTVRPFYVSENGNRLESADDRRVRLFEVAMAWHGWRLILQP